MVLSNYLMQSYSPYEPPISPTSFLHLTLLFIITGLALMAWFFTVEVTTHSSTMSSFGIPSIKETSPSPSSVPGGGGSRKGSKIFKEIFISFFGSLFLGIGAIFLILSIGVYI